MTLNSIRPEQDVTKAPGTSVRSSSITSCSPELRSLQMFGFGNKPNLRRDLPGPVFLLLLVRFWDRGVKKVELAARPCGVLADVESVSRSRTIFSPKMGVRAHVIANSGKLGCITSAPPLFCPLNILRAKGGAITMLPHIEGWAYLGGATRLLLSQVSVCRVTACD